jgi:hypothetical protein
MSGVTELNRAVVTGFARDNAKIIIQNIEAFPKLKFWKTSSACPATLKFAVLSKLRFAD